MDEQSRSMESEVESGYSDADSGMDELEGALVEGAEDDARLGNSVPPDQRGSNLDFILMSGVTTPPPDSVEQRAEMEADMDPSVPVSFFEKGVDDVDSSIGPPAMESSSLEADEVLVRVAPEPSGGSSAAASLRGIIADLSAEEAGGGYQTDTIVLEGEPESPEGIEFNLPEPEMVAVVEVEEDDRAEEGMEILFPEEVVEPADSVAEEDSGEIDEQFFSEGVEAVVESGASEPRGAEAVSEPEGIPVVEARVGESAAVLVAAPSGPRDLVQAERLLQELEAPEESTKEPLAPEAAHVYLKGWKFPELRDRDEETLDEEEAEADGERPARRRSRGRRSLWRRLSRWGLRAVVLLAVGVGLYQVYEFYLLETATDGDSFSHAEGLIADDRYIKGADAMTSFLQSFPESSFRADAQFLSAYALHRVPMTHAGAQENYEDAKIRFQQFIVENPDHEKRARAETLLGILYYRTGDQRNAIVTLRDSMRRNLDPGAYVPALRVLARSYAEIGELDNAHSAFMRVASLEDNIAPDQDYLELAGLYENMAEVAPTLEARARYLNAAIDQWDYALRVQSVLQTRRRDIRSKRDAVAGQLERQGYLRAGGRAGASPVKASSPEVSEADSHEVMEQQLMYVD